MLVEIGKFPEKQDKDPTMVPNETKSTPLLQYLRQSLIFIVFSFLRLGAGGLLFFQDIWLKKQQKHLQQRLSKVAVK